MVVYDIEVVYIPLQPDIINQVAVCILVNTLSVPITKRKREIEEIHVKAGLTDLK